MSKITTQDAVLAAKFFRSSQPAAALAGYLSKQKGGPVTSRAVATALREAVSDGRVKINYPKGLQVATYRFVRLTAKPEPATVTVASPRPDTLLSDKERAALLAVLYGRQGASSTIGQPIRSLLGIGSFDCMTVEQGRIARDAMTAIEAAIEPTPRSMHMHDDIIGTVRRLKRYSKQGDNKNNLLGQTMEEAAAFIQRALAAGVR